MGNISVNLNTEDYGKKHVSLSSLYLNMAVTCAVKYVSLE